MQEELISVLLVRVDHLIDLVSVPWYSNWSLWNVVVLVVTLCFLIKYTLATEDMKEEMVKQRILSDAHDIKLEIINNYFQRTDSQGKHWAHLKTSINQNNIVLFEIVCKGGEVIGHNSCYELREDVDCFEAYYIVDPEFQEKILQNIIAAEGIFKARVHISNGNKFLYTFQAITENWKKYKEGDEHCVRDTFILIKKDLSD